MAGQQVGLDEQHKAAVQEGSEQVVLPEEAAIPQHLQEAPADAEVSQKADLSRLEKLVRRAGSVVGMKLDPLVTVAERRTLNKLQGILDNTNHPLHTVISSQRSRLNDRLLLPKSRTNRLKNIFVSRAIKLFNSSLGRRANRQTDRLTDREERPAQQQTCWTVFMDTTYNFQYNKQ